MKAIQVCVIGVGAFGQHHVRHLCAHPLVAGVTVVDRDAARAEALADRHGVASAAAPDGPFDAAIVATPTESHAEIAGALLSRAVPTFVEKPLAADDAAAERLVALAAHAGVALAVGHIERASPAFQALKSAVTAPRHIAIRRHNSPRPVPPRADVVLDLMIHDIDLALCLADAPVIDVSGDAPDGTGREAATARLEFENGRVATLSASRVSPVVERTLTVHGRNGTFHADLAGKTLTRCADGAITALRLPERDNLYHELDAFLRAVAGDGAPLVSGAAGAAALRVATAVREALCLTQAPLPLTA